MGPSMSAKGHRVFAAIYDRLNAGAERTWLGKRRADLVAHATGVVLEIGAGTGANLTHYHGVERVVAAEPDPAMRARLESRLGRATVPVEVSDAPAEHLELADASVDTVVCTLVLCSVDDPHANLSELRRVLGPVGSCSCSSMCGARAAGRAGRIAWPRSGAGSGPGAIPTGTRWLPSSGPGSTSSTRSPSTRPGCPRSSGRSPRSWLAQARSDQLSTLARSPRRRPLRAPALLEQAPPGRWRGRRPTNMRRQEASRGEPR